MDQHDAFAHGHLPTAESMPKRLRSRWAAMVDPANVLPEYPRPQLVRTTWVNLNGHWDYAVTSDDAPQPASWQGSILVPFAAESQLGGIQRPVRPDERLWYRRDFALPDTAPGHRWLLHFGAVDWEAIVHVNGVNVGEHRGGYDPFTIDITDALQAWNGVHEIVVAVWDPTDRGPQPRGKQVLAPEGIWYTAVTGIWQTVWLEPVAPVHVRAMHAVPDLDAGTVTLHLGIEGGDASYLASVEVSTAGQSVASATGRASQPITLPIPDVRTWSPDDPFLYDLRVTLSGGDEVASYFGMRKISVERDAAGTPRLHLNNVPLFQYGVLDQGTWPDGLYTAPTDAALRFDIEAMKALGFNMIRKHGKVEPARWYAHADRLGMLVWQDMPSGSNDEPERRGGYGIELRAMVDALRSHPSIVMWVPFNEAWGQFETEEHVAWLRAYDPSRLVNNASGWSDRGVGDVADVHVYPGPSIPVPDGERALVLGEYGGLGLPLEGHTWVERDNWSYRSFANAEQLGLAYESLIGQLRFLIAEGLSAAVYTQVTDVEIEVNGLYTYDRDVLKLPPSSVIATSSLWEPLPTVREIVPTSMRRPQGWRFTTVPPAQGWMRDGFDDSAWDVGVGGFGLDHTPGSIVRTPWSTDDIWIRRCFELGPEALELPHWRVHHDDHAEVYLNGTLVASFVGCTTGYIRVALDARARQALRVGRNTLAVHVRQVDGMAYGPYIDIGIDDLIERPRP